MSSSSKADEVPLGAAAEPPSLAWGTSPSMYLSYGTASLKDSQPELTDAVAAVPSFSAALSPPMGLDYFGGEAVLLTPEHQEDMADLHEWVEQTGLCIADAKLKKALEAAREFGSATYKADEFQMMPPEVITVERELGDEFLILASDGVWESLTPAAACAFIQQRLFTITACEMDARGSPTLLAKELAEHAVGNGSRDNVSVVLVMFKDFWSPTPTPPTPATGSTTGSSIPTNKPTKTVRERKPNVRLAGPEWDRRG